MKLTIVYSEPKEIESFSFPEELEVILFDENSMKTRRKAKAIKGSFAAHLSPCVFVHDEKDNVYKIFYKEEYADPINEFLKWYNNEKSE